MSKLADAIKRTQRIEAAPMGFGAPKAALKATILAGVIAGPKDVSAAIAKGADLVILEDGASPSSANSAVVGVQAKNLSASMARELKTAGVDFVVFQAKDAEAGALLEEELGFVLELPQDADEEFLRALEALNLDAALLREVSHTLSVADQIALSRTAMLVRKPLLARVKPGITNEDLQCLRSAGIAAVLVEDVAAIEELKQQILALPPRKIRREERPAVTLPRGQAPQPDNEEDDE